MNTNTRNGDGVGLTPREQEILQLVVDGATNRVIAKQLGVSPRTVQKHLEHVYRKMHVKTRTAAAVTLLRQPLLVKLNNGKVI
jgi:DNA-binding NarL/FixJ family response regulator